MCANTHRLLFICNIRGITVTEAEYSSRASYCACGSFIHQPIGRGRPRRHCSDKCKDKASSERRAPVRKGLREFACAHCSSKFLSEHKKKYCGETCALRALIAGRRAKREQEYKAKPLVVQCRACANSFCPLYGFFSAPSHCADCEEKDGYRWVRVRRERIKAAFVEAVDRKKVFDRDYWVCQECGVKTISIPFKPNSAELDHIRPVSKGGEHSYRNTRCICRQCNLAKRDRFESALAMGAASWG
ncbi:HNH endonuclease [Noviherbaspirillum saxi]|uniref:HNH endonuclease n=1 Tax=Noviherbaspirillum saxi TaxID=2320863 RepID=A0A3A3FSK0_9BURK|nr:HNH endonuclease [Noviherbaspirillum saxi]